MREGQQYVVGRDADCDFVLDDERASRRHASLEAVETGWRLSDLGSKNGTAVDGRPIEAIELRDGCWLSFGGLIGRFQLLDADAELETARSRLERWHSSLEHQRALQPELGVAALLRRLLDSVLELAGAERGFVMLASASGDLDIACAAGLDPEELAAPEFSGSVGALERALERHSTVAVSDVLDAPSFLGRPSVVEHGIRALVCLPLAAADRLLGVLYADSRRLGATFEALDVEILEALAGHAALALAVARLEGELSGLVSELAPGVGEGASVRPMSWQGLRRHHTTAAGGSK